MCKNVNIWTFDYETSIINIRTGFREVAEQYDRKKIKQLRNYYDVQEKYISTNVVGMTKVCRKFNKLFATIYKILYIV